MPFVDHPPSNSSIPPHGRRVALVIGNGSYHPNAPNLRNPANDARLITDKLTEAGFSDVTSIVDVDYQAMGRVLRDFADKADPAEMAVIYFAGHGIDFDGQNHVIPVGAVLRHAREVAYQTITLSELLHSVDGAVKLRLVILDACRDNPFRTGMLGLAANRSIGRGLAKIEPTANVLVAYAAKAGTTASDGQGDNSPFAMALARRLIEPGLELGFMFRHVRDDVLAATNPRQEPFLSGSLSAEPIYFIPPRPEIDAPPEVLVHLAKAEASSTSAVHPDIFISYASADRSVASEMASGLEADGYRVWWDTKLLGGQSFRMEIEQQLDEARAVIVIWTSNSIASEWVEAEAGRARTARKLVPTLAPNLDIKTIPMPFGFLHTIGIGDLSAIKASLGLMGVYPKQVDDDGSDHVVWRSIKDSTDPVDFEEFCIRFPWSLLVPNAELRSRRLLSNCSIETLAFIKSEFPASSRMPTILERLTALRWQKLSDSRSPEQLRGFLIEHPKASNAQVARARLAEVLWEGLQEVGGPDEWAAFVKEFSDLPEAKHALSEIAEAKENSRHYEANWQQVELDDTLAAYERFLAAWTGGHHFEAAQQRLAALQLKECHVQIVHVISKHISQKQGRAAVKQRVVEDRYRAEGRVQVRKGTGDNDKLVWMKPGESFRDLDNGPELVLIKPGKFWMGSKDGEGHDDERPRHEVTFLKPLLVGKYPVTFAEWDAAVAVGGVQHKPDAQTWGRGKRPVIDVSWEDAKAFAAWISKSTGKAYRLLTEAEWEYCCRAGTMTAYSTGDSITNAQAQLSEGNFATAMQTVKVGKFPANPFGLFDMHGNVFEWCEDIWHHDYKGAPADGTSKMQSSDESRRVVRGGSWINTPRGLRSAYRNRGSTDVRGSSLGFRLARTL